MLQTAIKKMGLGLLCFPLLVVGCVGTETSSTANEPTSQTQVEQKTSGVVAKAQDELRDRLQAIAQTAQGRVGIRATVLETGESVSLNGEQRFPMQSVYKFPIAMAVLAQVDQGKLQLNQKVRVEASDVVPNSQVIDENSVQKEFTLAELLQVMIIKSDSTACDILLRLIGGPDIATQYLQSLGIDSIVVANTEQEIQQQEAKIQYLNYATPDAAVNLLQMLQSGKGLSKSSQALLLQWMRETTTGPQRIRGLLPKDTVVAHKTGTSRTVAGVTAATNDVGLVTLPNGQHLAIAVFVSDAKADQATREGVIAKATRAVWEQWSR